MYLVMGILIRPEAFPGLTGHLVIWVIYGISFALLFWSLKGAAPQEEEREMESWPIRKWLLLAGIFPLAAVIGELLLGGAIEFLAMVCWFGGILFGLVMFLKALGIVLKITN
jgi:hypothetical protein